MNPSTLTHTGHMAVAELNHRVPLTTSELNRLAHGGDNVTDLQDRYGTDLVATVEELLGRKDANGVATMLLAQQYPEGYTLPDGGGDEARRKKDERRALAFLGSADIATALHLHKLGSLDTETMFRLNRTRGDVWLAFSKPLKQMNHQAVRDDNGKASKVQNVSKALDQEDLVQFFLTQHPTLAKAFVDEELHTAALEAMKKDAPEILRLYEKLIKHDSIRSLHKNDLQGMLKLCIALRYNANTDVQVTTAIGGSPDPVNARLPSYLVPALEWLETLHEAYEAGDIVAMPRLRVLNGMRLGALTNDMYDETEVLARGHEKGAFMMAFVKRFVPAKLHSFIEYQDDLEAVDFPIPNAQQATESMQVSGVATEHLQVLEDQAHRMVEKLRLKPDNAVDKAMQYTAAHSIYFSDVVPPSVERVPDFAVTIGGQGENFFMQMRDRMLAAVKQKEAGQFPQVRVNLLAKTGTNPPYYNHEHDTPLSDVNGEPLINDAVWAAMDKHRGNLVAHETWKDMGEALLPYVQKQLPDDVNMQAAEAVYREFCKQFATKHLTTA